MIRGAWRVQVFCEVEADNYAAWFDVPRDKFVWVPYCTDVDEHVHPVSEGDYVFTGGLQQRDYETLYWAVKDLPVRVKVAAPRDKLDPRFVAPNMELVGSVSAGKFWSLLAGARALVLSLEPGTLRCPGVITYVTAMRLGKCVVVNEPEGASSYIQNGLTGLIVPPREPEELRLALASVLEDDELRRRFGRQAGLFAAEHLSSTRYLKDLHALCERWRCERGHVPGAG